MWQKHLPLGMETPTIIYMHEHEGGLEQRIPLYNLLVHHLHANVISIAHRGYSESEGEPTEEGMKKDADAILSFLENPEATSKEVAKMQ